VLGRSTSTLPVQVTHQILLLRLLLSRQSRVVILEEGLSALANDLLVVSHKLHPHSVKAVVRLEVRAAHTERRLEYL